MSRPFTNVEALVLDYREAAKMAGLSVSTFRRLIANGEGPPVARISERRVGVRAGDLRDWVAARVVQPTSRGDRT